MSTKLQRELTRRLKAEFPGIEIQKIRSRVHYVHEIRLGSFVCHLSVAASPRCEYHCINNTIKQLRRKFADAGVL